MGSIFGFSVPVFKILFATLLIYFGLKILFSGSGSFWGRRLEGKMIKTENKLVLSRGDLEAKKLSESYDVVLGEGFLDLDGIRELDKTRSVKINVVLGRLHLESYLRRFPIP
ncbi:MAG: hypothetical protein N3A69_13985 [Leptospiraceae bacterium]|nr:hypothetical protein [Leptospiraceae bacterium]